MKNLICKKLIHKALILGSLLILASCSSRVDEKESAQSSFEIKRIQAYRAKPEFQGVQSFDWKGFANHNLVHIQTCLIDKAIGVPVENEKVEIQTPYGKKVTQTEKDGCLTWNEAINFCYFSQEQYFSYPITIRGLGGHVGSQSIELAINPWQNDARSLLDLRFDKSSFEIGPKINRSLNSSCPQHSPKESSNPLYINHVSLKSIPKAPVNENKNLYQYDLEMTAQTKRISLDGTLVLENLDIARFELELILLESEKDQSKLWELSRTQIDLKLTEGKASKRIAFSLSRGKNINPNSQYKILFKIYPTLKKSNIKPIIGFLKMQGIQSTSSTILDDLTKLHPELLNKKISGVSERKLLGIELKPISADIMRTRLNQEPNQESDKLASDDDWGYEINAISLSYGGHLDSSYQKSNKILRARAEVCIVDSQSNLQNSPLTKTHFEVNVINKDGKTDGYPEKRIHKTRPDGCFETYFYTHYNRFQCESYIPSTFIIKALDGNVKNIEKSRKIAINPWNKSDFGYDLGRGQNPPALNCVPPKIALEKIEYSHQGNKQNGYLINQFLHLSLKKKYRLTLKPLIQQVTSYQRESAPESLTFGKIKVDLAIYTPKRAEVDYLSPNLSQFKFLTSTSETLTISPLGLIDYEFDIPFMVSDLPLLGRKNLLIVTLTPLKDHGPLRPGHYSVPFYGIPKGASLTASEYNSNIPAKDQKRIDQINAIGTLWPGYRDGEDFTKSPLEIYREEFKRSGRLRNEKTESFFGDIDTFNNMEPLNGHWRNGSNQNKKLYYTQIDQHDFKLLSRESGRLPEKQLKKFCRIFYPLPILKPKNRRIGGNEYKACIQDPKDHIDIRPMTHIQELLKSKEADTTQAPGLMILNPKYKGDDQGRINRGNAFFAAYGDRSSLSKGTRKSKVHSLNYSLGIEMPGPYYFGHTLGISQQYDRFQVENNTQMKAAFNRAYTLREVVNLQYNQLILSFNAKIRYCIAIFSKKGRPKQYHLCEKVDRLKRMVESWFFLGNTNANEHGLIADGNRPGENNRGQIIRGQYNFNRLWKAFEKDDTLTIIEETGQVDLKDAFQLYIQNRPSNLPYENYIDNSFPGLFIPEDYKPITECTGCQDP